MATLSPGCYAGLDREAFNRTCSEREKVVMPIDEAVAAQKVVLQDVDSGAKCLGCETCSGFNFHVWRKRCRNCTCPRQMHDVGLAVEKAGASIDFDSSAGGKGNVARLRHGFNNPSHDHDADACSSLRKVGKLGADRLKDFDKFVKELKKQARVVTPMKPKPVTKKDKPQKCAGCKESIAATDSYLFVEGDKVAFHEACLSCFKCKLPLSGQEQVFKQGKNFSCGRCHAESVRPRCAGCDELIFDKQYTKAEGLTFHDEHFCCWYCDDQLHGKEYARAKKEPQHPACLACFAKHCTATCTGCKSPIEAEQQFIKLSETHIYHQKDKCFKCKTCNTHMANQQTFLVDDSLFCKFCAEKAQDDVKCGLCHDEIDGAALEFASMIIHEECFKCKKCNVALSAETGALLVGREPRCNIHGH